MRSGIFRIDDEQGKRALEFFYRFANRVQQIIALLQIVVHEVRRDLCVSLRLKLVAFRHELILDGLKVFNDSIMNDGNTVSGQVWMCVVLGDAAVRCPARVRNADSAF